MTELENVVAKASELNSAALRFVEAYQGYLLALVSRGESVTLTVETAAPQATLSALLPAATAAARQSGPAPAVPSITKSARTLSARVTQTPAGAPPKADLKSGTPVFWKGRKGAFFRLARGTNGVSSFVDFLVDGKVEREKVPTAELSLEPVPADPTPAVTAPAASSTNSDGNAANPVPVSATSVPAPTSQEPTNQLTGAMNGERDRDAGSPRSDEPFVGEDEPSTTEPPVIDAVHDEGPEPDVEPAIISTEDEDLEQEPTVAGNPAKAESVPTRVYRALVSLKPSKEKPVSAKEISEKAGVPPQDVFEALIRWQPKKFCKMSGGAKVVDVTPDVAEAALVAE